MAEYDPKRTIPRPLGMPRHVRGMWVLGEGTFHFDDLTPEEIKDIEEPPLIEIDYIKVWE